jgi:hypothetical protein
MKGGCSNESPTMERWFNKTLDQAERVTVLTVHDQWAASQLKCMHQVLSTSGLSGYACFASDGAAQHRGNLTYGEWETLGGRLDMKMLFNPACMCGKTPLLSASVFACIPCKFSAAARRRGSVAV